MSPVEEKEAAEGGTEEVVSTLVGIDAQLDLELDGEFGGEEGDVGDVGDAGGSSSIPAMPGVGRAESFVLNSYNSDFDDDDDDDDHAFSDELEAAEAAVGAEADARGSDAGFGEGDESMMSSDGMTSHGTSSVLVTSSFQGDEVLGKSDQWAVV